MPGENLTGADLLAGGATGGGGSMTHEEFERLAELPKHLDSFMSEMRLQFSTLGEQILPTLDLVRSEIGKLQKTVDRVVHENRSLKAQVAANTAAIREIQLERAAAQTASATRRSSPKKG